VSKKANGGNSNQQQLFPLPPTVSPKQLVRMLKQPLWTQKKAHLIAHYLRLFVLITKHGTYIDGFAGPQQPDKPDTWAAHLALQIQPPWLKHFHLVDANDHQVEHLHRLRTAWPGRDVQIYAGDFNMRIDDILNSGIVGEREATFCLLDQRTFECHWETVKKLAAHKQGFKIELFYFFAQGWLDRALAAVKDTETIKAWWGTPDWHILCGMPTVRRAELVARRFHHELGYASVTSRPIVESSNSPKVMYHMVHASDHPEAAKLMARAYEQAMRAKPTWHEPPLFTLDQL
jgi:three-Cys-motif partner protein